MGRTKLFQQAGSPLIQGHSRMERPFITEWALGVAAAVGTCAVLMTAWGIVSGAIFHGGVLDAVFEVAHMSLALFGPGAALGAAVGVAVARRYGSVRTWRAGWIIGVVFGALSVYVTAAALGAYIRASNR